MDVFFLMDFESPTNVGRPCHASGVFFFKWQSATFSNNHGLIPHLSTAAKTSSIFLYLSAISGILPKRQEEESLPLSSDRCSSSSRRR